MIDFVFIDWRPAEHDIYEDVDCIDDHRDHEVDNCRSSRLVARPENTCDHRTNNRDQQPWSSSPHCEFGYHILGKIVYHCEKGQLGSIGADADWVGADEKENETEELLLEEDGDQKDGEERGIDN